VELNIRKNPYEKLNCIPNRGVIGLAWGHARQLNTVDLHDPKTDKTFAAQLCSHPADR
jgi:hypothetical protein